MSERTGIDPDIVTYGKIIGGGFPVGAVAGKKEIMEKLAPLGDVYQAGTLSANPVAMVAGLANMQQLTPKFYEDLNETSNNIYELLNKWLKENNFSDYNLVTYDSLFWLVPTQESIINPALIPQNLSNRFDELFKIFLEKGIYLSPNAYEIGFVSSAHTGDTLQELEKRLWN